MRELYEIKEMLMDELKEYGKKGELTSGTLEVVDKLSHAIKNLCKIIEMCEEEEYSMAGGSYENMGDQYNRGSYVRGGRRGGRRGANQYGSYNMGGYSRDHEMISELKDLMHDAPNDHIRKEFERFISKVENM